MQPDVTKQAYAMVAYYGMSERVGMLSYYDSTGQSDMALTKPYSEATAQQIDAEARRVIDEACARAEQVLTEHAAGLRELAELLLEREVVFTEDVERIFGKRKKDLERERREAAAKAGAESGAGQAAVAAAPAAADPDEEVRPARKRRTRAAAKASTETPSKRRTRAATADSEAGAEPTATVGSETGSESEPAAVRKPARKRRTRAATAGSEASEPQSGPGEVPPAAPRR